jgi:hypothetical protein
MDNIQARKYNCAVQDAAKKARGRREEGMKRKWRNVRNRRGRQKYEKGEKIRGSSYRLLLLVSGSTCYLAHFHEAPRFITVFTKAHVTLSLGDIHVTYLPTILANIILWP